MPLVCRLSVRWWRRPSIDGQLENLLLGPGKYPGTEDHLSKHAQDETQNPEL